MKSTDAHPGSTSTTSSRSFEGVRSADFRGLADHLPTHFKNLREHRYQGQDQDALLSVLSRADQERTRSLYAYAKGVHLCWLSMRDAPDWGVLQAQVLALLSPPLRAAAQDLGRDTMAHTSDDDATLEAVAKACTEPGVA